jgi:hypothetical protein
MTISVRTASVNKAVKALDDNVVKLKPVVQDALLREELKEKTKLSLQVHHKLQVQLLEWIHQHVEYLKSREPIEGVSSAQVHCAFCFDQSKMMTMFQTDQLPCLLSSA